MSDNDQVHMIKNVIDKKFTKSNIQLGDMLKNKAFQAITDFKNGFKYVTTQKVPETTEPAKEK
mgnify:CR=1 FL=1|tara:strand:+ start:155 stop:343 length:189 start_codon:yes stop_codon:yes gene_type:complete